MRNLTIYILLGLFSFSCKEEPPLEEALIAGSGDFLQVLNNPKHEVQIIYGQLNDGRIDHFYFGDSSKYFYPASTVKMLNAFAAVEKLENLGLALESNFQIDSTEHNPRNIVFDSLFSGCLRFDKTIQKIFTYSDNQANNLLFGFLGAKEVNETYQKIGLRTRIVHQLGESAFAFSPESNKNTYGIKIQDTADAKELTHDSRPSEFVPNWRPKDEQKGKGFIGPDGTPIEEPFDFSGKNYVPLISLLGSLERLVKPDFFDESGRYRFTEFNRHKLLKIMKMRPREMPHPIDTLPDNYVKFFMFGDNSDKTYPQHITILNKVGWAYGYLTDVAFIMDEEKDVEFFLAATVHVNENEIYNDGVYEYEEIGLPFLGELGRLIYDYELSRK